MPAHADTPSTCASGAQYRLERGGAVVVVTELAAALRSFAVGGVPVTETFTDEQIPPGACGITLAPWANRVEGGRWMLDGAVQQLDITEVPRNNAIHGLLRNAPYACVEQGPAHVVLESPIFPQHGYPFLARHRVRYELEASGALTVTQTFANDGAAAAPVVLGAHPYVKLGDLSPEQLTLTVAADSWLEADERLIPRAVRAVDGVHDLRGGAPLAALDTDTAYTGLSRGEDGRARTVLRGDDGREVTLWQDEHCGYVHIFASKGSWGGPKALAVEPMTGPANAFNTGAGLTWVEPGQEFSMSWGIAASW
ncbi:MULTISPECIES: aldose 1-epimerase family protein [Arthrobacter]|uniref:Aldose 1-epimerase family protein n=2 Tax=Arthrobacter TaxID=1663 RepID=A0ABU9KMR2_9MICC|nr:aldose 1-epimerase family protein [Arthrobacter sp. YJM1]MDP5227399.1 aldose 1-epimerase family protein [Arthrobacter sp. YJM1]